MFAYVAYIHRINGKIAYVCIYYADSGARIGLRRLSYTSLGTFPYASQLRELRFSDNLLDYPGKDTVVDVCVWIPTASGTHPVESGRGGPSVAWADTSHAPDVVTALDT